MKKLMSKAWEVLFLIVIAVVAVTFVLDLLRPYFALITIAIVVIILGAVVIGILKLIRNRRQFF